MENLTAQVSGVDLLHLKHRDKLISSREGAGLSQTEYENISPRLQN